VRYGKYPIGHPAILALGQTLGAEALVVPLETALVAVVLFALGARVTGRAVAALGVGLYALSPQALLTGATLLSQPLSALCLVVGLGGLGGAEAVARPAPRLAAAGLAFGYGVLVRPLPGALFALVAAAYVTWGFRGDAPGRRAPQSRWAGLLAFGLPGSLG